MNIITIIMKKTESFTSLDDTTKISMNHQIYYQLHLRCNCCTMVDGIEIEDKSGREKAAIH